MIAPIEQAMEVARKREKELKEDWYVLLNFAYFQDENYAAGPRHPEDSAQNWPKKRYWFSLAGAYTELGEDNNLIAAYGAANDQGMLEKESELVTMAQLYLQAEVPYKAATLLEREMESGSCRQEREELSPPVTGLDALDGRRESRSCAQGSRRLSDDGELDVRLGNTYLNLGNYDECINSVREGLRKGGLKNAGQRTDFARHVPVQQAPVPGSDRGSIPRRVQGPSARAVWHNQWIRVIEADVERNRQIQLARDAANKKRQEVEERRKSAGPRLRRTCRRDIASIKALHGGIDLIGSSPL